MDRLIWTAWRAFWVGLGASAVLIGQSLLAPPVASVPLSLPPAAAESIEAPAVAPVRVESSDPILSRSPFESARGDGVARIRNAS